MQNLQKSKKKKKNYYIKDLTGSQRREVKTGEISLIFIRRSSG